MGIPNAFNGKVGYWISKRGNTDAYYCFSASTENEVYYQLSNGIDGYVSYYEAQHSRSKNGDCMWGGTLQKSYPTSAEIIKSELESLFL